MLKDNLSWDDVECSMFNVQCSMFNVEFEKERERERKIKGERKRERQVIIILLSYVTITIPWRGVLLSQKKQFVGHGTAVSFNSLLACFNRRVCVAVLDMCASTMRNI